MFVIQIPSKQDVENLKIFLNRVDIKGSEAVPLASLLLAASQAKEVPDDSAIIPGAVVPGGTSNVVPMNPEGTGEDGEKDS